MACVLFFVSGLWRGLSPAMWRQMPGVGLYFFTLQQFKRAIETKQKKPLTNIQNMSWCYFPIIIFLLSFLQVSPSGICRCGFVVSVIGASARGIVTLTLHPFTVVKTRLESYVGHFQYPSLAAAFNTMRRAEGFLSFYRGLLATLLRDMPSSGEQ